MNNYNTYSTAESLSRNADLGGVAYFTGAFLAISWLIGVILFVIWVWSMLAMINLNSRFKYFLDEYRLRWDEQDAAKNSVSASSERAEALRNYKTEDEKRAERAEKLAKMKPSKFYMWVAVSIPILFIILAIVATLYS